MNEKGTPGNLKPFVKGDPRINRKGRPKDFDGLRKLAKSIAHEGALTKNQEPLIINGDQQTVLQAMLRSWVKGSPAQQMKFVAIAFGEVPTETKHTGDKDNPVVISVNHINYRDGLTTTEG